MEECREGDATPGQGPADGSAEQVSGACGLPSEQGATRPPSGQAAEPVTAAAQPPHMDTSDTQPAAKAPQSASASDAADAAAGEAATAPAAPSAARGSGGGRGGRGGRHPPPNTRTPRWTKRWTSEELEEVARLHVRFGNRWKELAKNLSRQDAEDPKSGPDVKNIFYSTMRVHSQDDTPGRVFLRAYLKDLKDPEDPVARQRALQAAEKAAAGVAGTDSGSGSGSGSFGGAPEGPEATGAGPSSAAHGESQEAPPAQVSTHAEPAAVAQASAAAVALPQQASAAAEQAVSMRPEAIVVEDTAGPLPEEPTAEEGTPTPVTMRTAALGALGAQPAAAGGDPAPPMAGERGPQTRSPRGAPHEQQAPAREEPPAAAPEPHPSRQSWRPLLEGPRTWRQPSPSSTKPQDPQPLPAAAGGSLGPPTASLLKAHLAERQAAALAAASRWESPLPAPQQAQWLAGGAQQTGAAASRSQPLPPASWGLGGWASHAPAPGGGGLQATEKELNAMLMELAQAEAAAAERRHTGGEHDRALDGAQGPPPTGLLGWNRAASAPGTYDSYSGRSVSGWQGVSAGVVAPAATSHTGPPFQLYGRVREPALQWAAQTPVPLPASAGHFPGQGRAAGMQFGQPLLASSELAVRAVRSASAPREWLAPQQPPALSRVVQEPHAAFSAAAGRAGAGALPPNAQMAGGWAHPHQRQLQLQQGTAWPAGGGLGDYSTGMAPQDGALAALQSGRPQMRPHSLLLPAQFSAAALPQLPGFGGPGAWGEPSGSGAPPPSR
ncbi:hypothetical protein HYH03_018863 [Edaphochlamys debaryana]|uniref:Myb-like domain-containing protein n=1 Tax=Edaphochlamys debaryana TaxID=47281 RepID=A0A835XFQ5_9CHLO|nr:hypothetical protein HYH03_018863 [Edaphochlamys debaryana]|eukprot:KAG2482182.1 hypothetical protein HYH03_018863 [Edaphochlamys debaryana]